MHKHLPQRWDSVDAWYFVTVVTRARYPYFKNGIACQILLDAFRSARTRRSFRLGALVIMPDHWHALIKPGDREAIESIVGSIKQRTFHASSHDRLHGMHSGSAAFHGGVCEVIRWQPRFMDHRIRDEADYFQHVEYMRLNPHRQELVETEDEAWPWWFLHPDPFA
ncbi:MAG: transposase [Syntrophobacteraceae bacterium]